MNEFKLVQNLFENGDVTQEFTDTVSQKLSINPGVTLNNLNIRSTEYALKTVCHLHTCVGNGGTQLVVITVGNCLKASNTLHTFGGKHVAHSD